MTIEKMENSAWLGFPKNDPSVTDTVYVPITGGKKNGVYERILYRYQYGTVLVDVEIQSWGFDQFSI